MGLFRRKPQEPLARELAILRAEYPGQYCSVGMDGAFGRCSGKTKFDWSVYTESINKLGHGSTFREALLSLKIEEGKNHD